jgi:glycosyltransferase involved in cell wall biosynthesis
MRLLHVTTFLQGGAGQIITRLAIAQHRRGHDVRVVTDAGGESGYASYPEYLDALNEAGVPAFRVKSTFKRDAFLNASAAQSLYRLCAGWPPDVVHVHAATPSVVVRQAGIAGPATEVPLIHTMHGWGISKTASQASTDLAALEHADVVTTPSHASRELLRRLGLSRCDVRVVPYGISSDEPSTPPDIEDIQQLHSTGARTVVLCIGTIGTRKNQRLLVDALATPALESVVAVFVGDGDVGGLAAHATALRVADRALVLGPRPEAARYLALADALVLPSRNEGLPLVVLEAMRSGIPVVAARIPEIAEALGPENDTFLFEPEHAADLARALRSSVCARDRVDRCARSRQRFRREFREERMLSAYGVLYRDAVHRSARGALRRRRRPSDQAR